MSHYSQHLEGCAGAHKKLTAAQLAAATTQAAGAVAQVLRWKEDGTLPLLRLPGYTGDVAEIERLAKDIRAKFTRLVVLGTGGSSLGGKTLVSLRGEDFTGTNHFPIHFIENVDPLTLGALLTQIDLTKTAFLAVSKSGDTVEITSQLLMCMDAVTKAGGSLKTQFTAITMPGDRAVRALAEKYGMPILNHDPNIGGRFSVLSLVGLLPAAVAGLDIAAIRKGAGAVMDALATPESSAVVQGAAASFALMEAGISTFVLMPYADRLADFGMWYRQLWAESLGKDGKGSTPIRAMGTVDQHSQVQLYLDGPKDKFFTFLLLENAGLGPRVPQDTGEARLSYLAGKALGDVMQAEQEATLATLMRHNLPVRALRVKTLDEAALGALLMHYMLETMLTAQLMGVNAFDQPAVEESKDLTRKLLAA